MTTRKQLMIGAVVAGLAISGSGLTAVALAQNAAPPAAPTGQQAAPHRVFLDDVDVDVGRQTTRLN